MVRRVLFVGLAIAVVGACALPSASEFAKASTDAGSPATIELPDGAIVPAEAGSVTTNEAGVVVEAGVDGGPIVDLLQSVDSTFDETDKCGNDSGGFQATLTPSPVAHSGSGACLLCRTGAADGNVYTLDTQIRNVHPRKGQQFMASAYVRRPDGDTDATTITISLRSHNGDFNAVDQADSDAVALTSDYMLISVTLNTTENTSNIDMFIGNQTPDGLSHPCFLVDDDYVWQSN